MKFSSKIERCSLSPMRKFAAVAERADERGLHIFRLNIGQPDLPTPDSFWERLRNFHQPVLSYSPSNGLPEYLDAVCHYYHGLGVDLSREQLLGTTGGSEALQMALSAILDEGDEIVIPEPFYPNYATMTALTGARVRPITTCPEEGYRYAERERVEACINEHTRAIMITNPGNPTGCVINREELKLMLDIAKEHGLFIICDEVYREFVYNGERLMSALQFEGYEDNVIVIDSVSKRFSACGTGGRADLPEPGAAGPLSEMEPDASLQPHGGPAGRRVSLLLQQELLRRHARGIHGPAGHHDPRPAEDPRRGLRSASGRLLRDGRPARG